MQIETLKSIGFSDKTAAIYLALLSLGPSSVRKLAEQAAINRGSVYDSLKWLQAKGLVDLYEKDTKQYFFAHDPAKIQDIVVEQQQALVQVEKKMDKVVAELSALYQRAGERPVARYYEREELAIILEDILATCEASPDKLYRMYSAEGVREYLYEQFPTFSDVRVAKGIAVQVIALGEGGELRGLDERKYLGAKGQTPTTIMIYPGKTAYISLDAKNEPVGVVIENAGVYETQKAIFDQLWTTL